MLATLMLTLGLSTVGQADWFHFANNVRMPDGNLVHAVGMVQNSVVATDLGSGWVCVRYDRNSKNAKKGRVKTTARFLDGGNEVGKLVFTTAVSDNRILNCKEGPDATIGTVVEFTHEFLGMPRVLGKKGEYVDVSGVVGESMLEPVVSFDMGTIPLTSADEDERGRIVSTRSLFVADKNSQKHPVALSQTAITNRVLLGPVVACTSYFRHAEENPSKGRFVSTATVIFPDGETEKLSFRSGVRKGNAVSCKELSRDAPAGTVVENEIDLIGMPRLDALEGAPENFVVNTSLSTAGDVDLRLPSAPVVDGPPQNPDPGPGTPPPPPPGNTGALSAADQRCISRVLYAGGSGSRQIVRPRGNIGGKFEVFGPNSQVGGDGHPIDSTLGFGSTYAAACANYESRRGSLGPEGPNLSAGDVALWVWYANMNAAGGPTAVRKDPRGGFHGDYWRPATGSVILNGGSPGQVLGLLRSHGL